MSDRSKAFALYLADIDREFEADLGAVKNYGGISVSAFGGSPAEFPILGSMADADIMAIAFIVMMEASKSAAEDLKSIMDGVKAINNAKAQQRRLDDMIAKLRAAAEPDGRSAGDQPPESDTLRLGDCHRLDVDLATRTLLTIGSAKSDEDLEAMADAFIVTRERIRRASATDESRGQLDALNELSELESMRLQQMLDRRQKFMEMLSNILKKMAATNDAIVENLK